MFENFANVWTPVGLSGDLKPGKPLAMRIAGERVVLFRDVGSQPGALIDRCPHRGVALSLGKVVNGEIECPFHGWRFDRSGANCRVPWNPDAKRDRLGGVALPVREIAGLLWLYTGVEPSAEPEPSELQRQRIHQGRQCRDPERARDIPRIYHGHIGSGNNR